MEKAREKVQKLIAAESRTCFDAQIKRQDGGDFKGEWEPLEVKLGNAERSGSGSEQISH